MDVPKDKHAAAHRRSARARDFYEVRKRGPRRLSGRRRRANVSSTILAPMIVQDAVQEVEGKGKVLDKTADVGSFSGVS